VDGLNNILDDIEDKYEIYNLSVSLLTSIKYYHLVMRKIKLLKKLK